MVGSQLLLFLVFESYVLSFERPACPQQGLRMLVLVSGTLLSPQKNYIGSASLTST